MAGIHQGFDQHGLAHVATCEDELTHLVELDLLSFNMTTALTLVCCYENKLLFTNKGEERLVISTRLKLVPMSHMAHACRGKRLRDFIKIDALVKEKSEALTRPAWLFPIRVLPRFPFLSAHSPAPAWEWSHLRDTCWPGSLSIFVNWPKRAFRTIRQDL